MKHRLFLTIIAIEIAILILLAGSASRYGKQRRPDLDANQQLVKNLMLTDLALWSESRYTRHPSQADFFAPFQDFPSAIDHFPAGSMVAPPGKHDFVYPEPAIKEQAPK